MAKKTGLSQRKRRDTIKQNKLKRQLQRAYIKAVNVKTKMENIGYVFGSRTKSALSEERLAKKFEGRVTQADIDFYTRFTKQKTYTQGWYGQQNKYVIPSEVYGAKGLEGRGGELVPASAGSLIKRRVTTAMNKAMATTRETNSFDDMRALISSIPDILDVRSNDNIYKGVNIRGDKNDLFSAIDKREADGVPFTDGEIQAVSGTIEGIIRASRQETLDACVYDILSVLSRSSILQGVTDGEIETTGTPYEDE